MDRDEHQLITTYLQGIRATKVSEVLEGVLPGTGHSSGLFIPGVLTGSSTPVTSPVFWGDSVLSLFLSQKSHSVLLQFL